MIGSGAFQVFSCVWHWNWETNPSPSQGG